MGIEIKDLKPHITHFSEQIRLDAEHMQEVQVGGEIQDIISPLSLMENDPSNTFYILKVDDLVGSLYVYVSQLVMEHHTDILQIGKVAIFDGFVKVLTRKAQGNFNQEKSIVAYDARALSIGDLVR